MAPSALLLLKNRTPLTQWLTTSAAVGRVLEVEEQPFLLKQPHDEVTVAFAVLSDIAVRFECTADAELVFRETFITTKYLPDHLLYGLILIDLRVIPLRNQAQP